MSETGPDQTGMCSSNLIILTTYMLLIYDVIKTELPCGNKQNEIVT